MHTLHGCVRANTFEFRSFQHPRETKNCSIIKCQIYQKLTQNIPWLLPVTEDGYKNGSKPQSKHVLLIFRTLIIFFLFIKVKNNVLCQPDLDDLLIKVYILDVNAITSLFTDASLNIPNIETASRVDKTTDPHGH